MVGSRQHQNCLGIDGKGFVLTGSGVEVDKFVSWDGERTVLARDEDPFVGTATADAVVVSVNLVLHLGVVGLEGRRKPGRRWIDEHEVPPTGDGEAIADSFAGFNAVEREAAFDRESAYSTAEIVGGRGEGFDAEVNLLGMEGTLDGLGGVEEGVVEEVEEGASTAALVLNDGKHIEVEGVDYIEKSLVTCHFRRTD